MVQGVHPRENERMKWLKGFTLLLTFTVLAGCPDKQEIPPKPQAPEPQVRHYRDLIHLEGRAPHVGTRYEIRQMMASHHHLSN